jgi:ArsR family transcriptional regulator
MKENEEEFSIAPMEKKYLHLSQLFKVLAHPIRLKIIDLLIEKKLCVCKIEPEFDLSQAAISKHLKLLVDSGILNFEKDGTKSIYSIKDPNVLDIISFASQMLHSNIDMKEQDLHLLRESFEKEK